MTDYELGRQAFAEGKSFGDQVEASSQYRWGWLDANADLSRANAEKLKKLEAFLDAMRLPEKPPEAQP